MVGAGLLYARRPCLCHDTRRQSSLSSVPRTRLAAATDSAARRLGDPLPAKEEHHRPDRAARYRREEAPASPRRPLHVKPPCEMPGFYGEATVDGPGAVGKSRRKGILETPSSVFTRSSVLSTIDSARTPELSGRCSRDTPSSPTATTEAPSGTTSVTFTAAGSRGSTRPIKIPERPASETVVQVVPVPSIGSGTVMHTTSFPGDTQPSPVAE